MKKDIGYSDYAEEVLGVCGIPVSDDSMRQAEVMVAALQLFHLRSERHGDVWKASGWQGMLVDARKKVERLWNEFMAQSEIPEDLDSAYDAINYLAFFIRAQHEDVGSTWNWGYDDRNG